uniref:growth/differentiation factor 8 n=1 Tax=Doryrhamphus excisus TaxID=161450 RepID=UPI0025ADF5CE|nr:growth/differentiation factor 8 [Doryrhamphus excisus]
MQVMLRLVALLLTLCCCSYAQRLSFVFPRVGSTAGATRLTLTGDGFAQERQFQLYPKDNMFGNHVMLVSNTRSIPCDVERDSTHDSQILCYTRPMPSDHYVVRVSVDGVPVRDENICNGVYKPYHCSFYTRWYRTPTITSLSPVSGPPQTLVTLRGQIFTDVYGSNTALSSNGKNLRFLRSYMGGMPCEMLKPESDELYKLKLDSESSNWGHMSCRMTGTYVGHHNMSYILDESYGSSGEGWPHQAREGTLDVDTLVEAVKMGILNSLGMDKEPQLTQKVSDEELSRMYQLYWDKLGEMRGNSTRPVGTTMSTVLFPAAVAPIKAPQSEEQAPPGPHPQWYRAVFQKNPKIHMEMMLTRAELKLSRRILIQPTQVNVKVKRMKVVNSTTWTQTGSRDNNTLMPHATVDISPKVEKWIRADDKSLVVDVRMAEGEGDPILSLELDFTRSKSAHGVRLPRSNREDDCNDQGWCCRKSANVSFRDIGWTDWVVAPTEYTMHLCDGTCPHNYKPASMHTQVKTRLHQIMKDRMPRPCCVPASYEPMVLMHYDSKGKLKLTPFNDLIVSKCHCA